MFSTCADYNSSIFPVFLLVKVMLPLFVLIIVSAHAAPSPWDHSWETAGAAWWGDFGYSLLTDQQAQFVAKNYKVASIEKCTGKGQGVKTEFGIYQTAAQLKKINPTIKVTFYWHTGQAGIGCFANNATFMAHPEWWLRDDNGKVAGAGDSTHSAGQIQIDPTNEEAVKWWVSVPLAGTVHLGGDVTPDDAARLIDGVLADGSGYEKLPNISAERLEKLYTAKLAMISRLQAAFDAAGRGGVVYGNGLNEYDQDPSDPHGRRILEAVGGVQNEHFAAFEQVDPKTGLLRLDKVSDALDNIEWASAANSSKQIFCSFWAGFYTNTGGGPSAGLGAHWPKYFDDSQPCGIHSTTPNCTRKQLYNGWKAELEKYLPFNLAAFLTVAGTNTWFTQAVW
jgi:hypothetical protein